MTERRDDIDWEKTTFDGSRREQLRRGQTMSLRQRLEALDQLTDLAARMQTMPRLGDDARVRETSASVHEEGSRYAAGDPIHTLILEGCTPTPLASYLKALGILRLVAEQVDPDACGYWMDDVFVLQTTLDREALQTFFLDRFRPTPILSPWNGRAGFLEGDEENSSRKGSVVLNRIMESKGDRLSLYRAVIECAKKTPAISGLNSVRVEIKRLDKLKKAHNFNDEDKEKLSSCKKQERVLKASVLMSLRSELPDEFLEWMDACLIVAEDPVTAPLLGSGGNEGSMDFSINHASLLTDLFDTDTDQPTSLGKEQIANALFGAANCLAKKINPGFLSPGALGGPNMGSGFGGTLIENPWNAVLMLEGALLFASIATRRLESQNVSSASFPFTVAATLAGNGTLSPSESARSEFWAPLWGAPSSLPELQMMLAEGRVTLGGKRARDGIGVARAIAKLGVDRGISAFQRFGIYERRGQGYYVAAPLARIPVRRNTTADLIDQLDGNGWLYKFRKLAKQTSTARLRDVARRLDDSLFDLARFSDPRYVQQVLIVLGQAQGYLASSPGARENCPPVPRLSVAWSTAADDRSAAFRISAALAGLHLQPDDDVKRPSMPMAVHFAPVDPDGKSGWPKDPNSAAMIWHAGDLSRNLYAVAQRRLLGAQRDGDGGKPFAHFATAPLAHIAEWLASPAMDTQVDALLRGLALARIPRGFAGKAPAATPLPATFAALKPLFCTEQQLRDCDLLTTGAHLPLEPAMLKRLWLGSADAMRYATRRLLAAGLHVDTSNIDATAIDSRRLLAALLIPIANEDLKRLLKPLQPSTRDNQPELASA